MLIRPDVKSAIQRGALVHAKPIAPWSVEKRVVLLCEPIRASLVAGRQDPDEKVRESWAKVEAAFSHYIEGGLVTEDLLKQLIDKKHEHWEFRCRKPRPSIRVFGRFAMPDVFVSTHAVYRKQLGGMWSPAFEHEKLVCEEHWAKVGLAAPFTDGPQFRYNAYTTENAQRKLTI
jgi:hypothetical protein